MRDKIKMMEAAVEACRAECAAIVSELQGLSKEPPPKLDEARRAHTAKLKGLMQRKAKAEIRLHLITKALETAKVDPRH